MANQWLRLWHDMPNDPKWRTISRASGQPISLVIALYMHLLVDASRNVTRGHVSVTPEDLASALDVTEDAIVSIFDVMQGRVMDGDHLTGWETRQVKKEDEGNPETGTKSAAERKRNQRTREKTSINDSNVTQCHESSRDVTTDKDKDKDKNISSAVIVTTENEPSIGRAAVAEIKKPNPTAPALLSIAMRECGIESQPGDPRIIKLAEQNVSVETVKAACAEAKRQKPDERISPGLVASIAERWAKQAAALQASGAKVPEARSPPVVKSPLRADRTWSDPGLETRGRLLGIEPLSGESRNEFDDRIYEAERRAVSV